jgi:Mrp family chromosome partitioning ATPase
VAFRALPPRGKCEEPQARFAPELLAYHAPGHPVSGQYRELLTALLTASPGVRHQVLLFTPALSEADCATVLLNVAISAARQGRRRVVVVDANLRHPEGAARLGLPEVPGLREVLAGAATLEQALQETDQVNLLALTAGAAGAGGGVRFVAETMRSLLRQLRQRFDLVLVNGPRWDGRPDVTVLGAACDAVYLVLSEQEAETPEVDDLLQVIPEQGARLAGCILAGR